MAAVCQSLRCRCASVDHRARAAHWTVTGWSASSCRHRASMPSGSPPIAPTRRSRASRRRSAPRVVCRRAGRARQQRRRACVRCRWWRRGARNPSQRRIYLDGGFGVGKTHLLAGLWRATGRRPSGPSWSSRTSWGHSVCPDRRGAAGPPARVHRRVRARRPGRHRSHGDPADSARRGGGGPCGNLEHPPGRAGRGAVRRRGTSSVRSALSARFDVLTVDGEDYRHRGNVQSPLPLTDGEVLERAEGAGGALRPLRRRDPHLLGPPAATGPSSTASGRWAGRRCDRSRTRWWRCASWSSPIGSTTRTSRSSPVATRSESCSRRSCCTAATARSTSGPCRGSRPWHARAPEVAARGVMPRCPMAKKAKKGKAKDRAGRDDGARTLPRGATRVQPTEVARVEADTSGRRQAGRVRFVHRALRVGEGFTCSTSTPARRRRSTATRPRRRPRCRRLADEPASSGALYAESRRRRRSLLLVIQGMDTSGKGGDHAPRGGGVRPGQGGYTSFKAPTAEERGSCGGSGVRCPRPGRSASSTGLTTRTCSSPACASSCRARRGRGGTPRSTPSRSPSRSPGQPWSR